MAAAHLPLCCRCAIEYWESSGERTRARLNGLVEHYATVYGEKDLVPLQEQAAAAVPAWKFTDQ